MFSFANPEYLYLLILIPVIFGLFLLSRMIRAKNIRKYGNPALLEAQMPDVSKYKPWIKISIQLVALALIVIILARPRAMGNSKAETINVQGIEVMVALDVSNSMLASSTDDPNGISRLQQAKLLLEKLIDKLGNDKVGLIVLPVMPIHKFLLLPISYQPRCFLAILNRQWFQLKERRLVPPLKWQPIRLRLMTKFRNQLF